MYYNPIVDEEIVNYDLTKFSVAFKLYNFTTDEIISFEDSEPYVKFKAHIVNLRLDDTHY